MSQADAASPRFRVLVPVWGERYIRDFCAISLPALLAEGNLPALTRAGDCEIIFLTVRSSVDYFLNSDGINRIKDFCPYSFVFIDDLLPLESYGIILTVAYGRGIASMGSFQTSTSFIFLNADFVLSNGILSTVIDRLGKGYNAVMSASLRSKQEDVVDELQKRVSGVTGTLDASPAELVRLTLDALHLTARASLVNQELSHHSAANQFFWRVDDDTLIGRFFLLFMLCIRPERPFTTCVGWCDYTFIPELVPSGNYDVITDSDEGFILEMQARRGELHYIRSGRIAPKDYAPRLSFWTTAQHRDYATRSITFHTGRLPDQFDAVASEADRYMTELFGHLSQPPTSHLRHPYWTSGLLHFQDNIPANATPPELPRYVPRPLEAVRHRFDRANRAERLGARLVRRLVGTPPNVSPFHYGYLDYANFSKQIRSFRAQSRHPIYVRDHASPLDTYVQGGAPCAIVKLTDIDKRRSDTPRFDGAIITLSDHMLQDLPRLLRLVAAQCRDDAPILICVDAIHAVIFQSRYAVYGDMIELMGSELPPAARVESFALVTAPARFVPAYLLFQAKEITGSRRLSAWLGAVIVALPAYLSLLKANLRRKPATSADPGVCTSATIWLRGPWESKTRAMAERALQFDTAYYNRINTDVAQAGSTRKRISSSMAGERSATHRPTSASAAI